MDETRLQLVHVPRTRTSQEKVEVFTESHWW